MAVVYQHRRLDNNEVFYIGIGKTDKRASSAVARNELWHNVVNKVGGFDYDIVAQDLTWAEACDMERQLILEYGRRDLSTGVLVNMTNGGDGLCGYKPTKESNKKRSQSLQGKKKVYVKGPRKSLTEEHKIKLRKPKSNTQNYKKPKSLESISKSAATRRKVTLEQVKQIHKLFIEGLTRGVIAKELGISVDLVQKWKHIPVS